LAQIADWWSASPTTTCWTMVGTLCRHSTDPVEEATHPQPAVRKEEATALAAVDVGAFCSVHGGAILQGWFSENWSVCPAPVAADHK
jgi:hypothetical protein